MKEEFFHNLFNNFSYEEFVTTYPQSKPFSFALLSDLYQYIFHQEPEIRLPNYQLIILLHQLNKFEPTNITLKNLAYFLERIPALILLNQQFYDGNSRVATLFVKYFCGYFGINLNFQINADNCYTLVNLMYDENDDVSNPYIQSIIFDNQEKYSIISMQ